MDKIYDKCCGIDVHKKLIVACFRCGKKQEVREFGATTRELLELADWLKEGANIMLSGTVSDINGKSARSILEYLLTGKAIDGYKYDEMYEQEIIAHNLKATKEQIVDDLNGFMSSLQRRMVSFSRIWEPIITINSTRV